ncbi:MAG: MarR family transcriptional regulator [Dehalococcoidia bacterium]|nr:MarR family transcriptional regulator [Dehalococcoidia bacterium]
MTSEERTAAEDATIQALFGASGLLDALRLRVWDTEGLTVTQLRLLAYVFQSEGISNAELADRLMVTRPSVSALLDRLERGGFIRREISQTDRRGICIWLQDRGRDAVTHTREENREYVRGLLEDLDTGDLVEITAALEQLAAAGRARRARDLAADPNAF